jgi:hypothetical protein
MPDVLEQLVDEAVELTGSPRPDMLSADAPVLSDEALIESDAGAIYLVGLIGGKDVGKSSLVNALAGRQISRQSSWGQGTHRVIAYAHASVVDELRAMLDREAPEQYEIITHDVAALRRQVLLDLPDIDSRWTEHVQLTRRMLRHLLYPLWIQSVEKYADQQPQQLLAQVADGNDPANFLFCLNKADQLRELDGADELRDDFARRLGATLGLAPPPRVYLISAIDARRFDLPELRRALSCEKSSSEVDRSVDLAGQRRQRSLLRWLDEQGLSHRVERTQRLLREAQELTSARIGVPLLEQVIPRMTADPAHRMALTEPAIAARMSRWPIVNVIGAALSPAVALVRKNLGSSRAVRGATEQVDIDAYLSATTGRTLASLVQTSFAQLHQTDPAVAKLYETRKLWDDAPADFAAGELSRRLAETFTRQREAAVRAVSGRARAALAPLRWLLTIGAVLWFPLVQPILERALTEGLTLNWRDLGALLVPLLGASYLLHSAAFLLIWFFALWLIVRWSTARKIARLSKRWSSAGVESDLSPTGQCVRWMDDLLEPIARNHERARSLLDRVEQARTGDAPNKQGQPNK